MQQNQLVSPHSDIEIQSHIMTIGGVQVMLDRDLAMLYGVETGAFNRQVKRNLDRFPTDFMFQLSKSDMENLRCQFGISSWGGTRYLPYAFTEGGIAMLSGILKSRTAVETNIRIMRAFVAMRRTLSAMAPILTRLDAAERRQITDQAHNEERFKLILDAMNADKFPPQKIFFKNSIEDAHSFIIKLVKKALDSIVLVDGYVNDVSLDILSKKRVGVNVTLVTHPKSALSEVDLLKFNKQYPTLTQTISTSFHDRFLILDNSEVYQIGASIKDVGRLCFAVSKLEPMFILPILQNAGLTTD